MAVKPKGVKPKGLKSRISQGLTQIFRSHTDLTNLTDLASRCALAVGNAAERFHPGGTREFTMREFVRFVRLVRDNKIRVGR